MAKVSVIIPTMKGREEMLQRLLSTLPEDCERIVINDEHLLLAAKRNKGAYRATGELLLFIDDDNTIEPGAVNQMVRDFSKKIGVMGMMACYANDRLRIADGGSIRNYVSGFMYGVNTNKSIWKVDQLPYKVSEVANAFMIPKELFSMVGGFDEENFPIDLDEADICKRILDLGRIICMNPKAICYHDSITYSYIPNFRRPMNAYFLGRNRILYQKKHLPSWKLLIHYLIFLPIFILLYSACLLFRGKPHMVFHFAKGVMDGLSGCKKNPYQSQ